VRGPAPVPSGTEPGLVAPGRSAGLLDVARWRFLLSLLVKKELRVRYRGSALGLLWSYVKPAVQLAVFYVAMGKFLGLERDLPNFVIYLFSGIVVVNFFSEVFNNTTKSIVLNADLVKKIYMPRELFPVASVQVALVHLVPQVVVLVVASLAMGWRPGLLNLAAGVGAFALTGLTALGIGLVFSAVNVYFRDAENLVELILSMATWLSPVLYKWDLVMHALSTPLWVLYQLNPITVAVELAHYGFWAPSARVAEKFATAPYPPVPHEMAWWTLAAVGVSTGLVLVGQLVFRRLEGRFAQEL